MIDLSCPSCGRAGSIPREKINTRLVCKKCLKVFHMNTAGRTILGEPANVEPAHKAAATSVSDGPRLPSFDGFDDFRASLPNFSNLSTRSILIGMGVVLFAAVLYTFMSQAPERLIDTATTTAERFAADDLAYLKSIATAETKDDVVRWFDAVHPALVKARTEWKTTGARVQVMIIDEDPKQRRGETHAFVYPAAGTSHATSIATAANEAQSPGANQPVDLKLVWTLEGGRWRLNGRDTLMAKDRPM